MKNFTNVVEEIAKSVLCESVGKVVEMIGLEKTRKLLKEIDKGLKIIEKKCWQLFKRML